jgi:hypothetical protein
MLSSECASALDGFDEIGDDSRGKDGTKRGGRSETNFSTSRSHVSLFALAPLRSRARYRRSETTPNSLRTIFQQNSCNISIAES